MTSLLEHNLLHAAEVGNKEEVESILKLPHVNVNAKKERWGYTALHYACEKNTSNHSTIVKLLLDKGADVNVVASGGNVAANVICPLYLACKYGCLETAQSLIDKGANVSGAGPWAMTHLQTASKHGHSKVVSLLLERGADVNASLKSDGKTALHTASKSGHSNVVSLLLERGADVNASLKSNGKTALHTASKNGHSNVVSLLLQNGADVNASMTRDGETALHFACSSGSAETAKLLIDKGANVHAKTKRESKTPLQFAVRLWYDGDDHLNIVKLFLEDLCIDATGHEEGSILHDAAYYGKTKTVRFLLEKGANVNAKDEDGRTPLHLALHKENTQTGLFLMKDGASLNVKDNEGYTPVDLFPVKYRRKVMHDLFPEVLKVFTVCQGKREELKQHIDRQKAETTTLQNQVVSLKEQLASLQEASSDEENDKPITARSSVHMESHEQTQAENTALQKQLQSLKEACSEKDEELYEQLSEKVKLRQQVASLQEELTSCKHRNEKQEGEKAGLSEQLRSLQDDYQELREQKEAEITNMREKTEALEMELKRKSATPKKQVESTKEDAVNSTNRTVSPDNELHETESEKEEEDMVALYDQLKQRHQEWVDQLKKEIETRQNQVDSMKESDAQIRALNQQLDVYRKREIEALEEKVVRRASKKQRKS